MKSIPLVFKGLLEKIPPKTFNTICIDIDAKLDSDLNFDKAHALAQKAVNQSLQILWNFDFGLFNELALPLSDTTQYKSLHLALDHFFETLWKTYKEHTIGAVIYEGSVELEKGWPWDPDQWIALQNELLETFKDPQSFYNHSSIRCTHFHDLKVCDLEKNEYGKNLLRKHIFKSAVDYFEILTAQFPDELLPYVLFDFKSVSSKLLAYQFLQHEAFDFIQLALKNAPIRYPHAMGWEDSHFPNGFIGTHSFEKQMMQQEPHLGVVVPSKGLVDPKKIKEYEEILNQIEIMTPMRFIFERQLAADWKGLDDLLVFEIDPMSKRKLEGFIAAGGRIIHAHSPLGVSEETSYEAYKKNLETV